MNLNNIIVEESGERIDALLSKYIETLSRSSAQNLCEKGLVSVNGVIIKKNYKVRIGDEIKVEIPEPEEPIPVPQNIPLNIMYEDEFLIVVNKERGMVVHPAPGHYDGTLVNALLYHCGNSLSGIGGEKRPGIVHRIDMDTSGLIIVAKNDFAHQKLSMQLSDHSLCREYEAIVNGTFRNDSGTIDKPIGRNPNDRKKMAITDKNSRNAVTHYSVIERYNKYTHIKCQLETGRTHQIRVHMASIGHPLLGDYTYGAVSPDKGLTGQCLHARSLKFIHPSTEKEIIITSDLPEYFTSTLSKLGGKLI